MLCVYSVRDMIWWSQIDIYMCDMILCYMCVMISGLMLWDILYIRILGVLHDWNFVCSLNTTCNCIRYYVMWILVLYYVVMCVYVDNCVDNFNINVDNFFVAFATLLRTFLKMLCFRVFSHIISCYLLFALVFSLFHYIVIINYIVYTI